ncbi:MAG: geranylgeranylglyceryl/heptaprenylglyceryl phosphate synthase [Candidatus Thermoplasmatota archaeon]|nr:geranylgeranylglyceryl/heptaprenylglyceryl phosphate synthase [Candidatus Thermoplasmatota archaeon]MBU1940573.1 geranylgeranylglyceryl/heptaprenylglyceryl phosphate synthase [Candidatus Thermoplasmatota archaeon]
MFGIGDRLSSLAIQKKLHFSLLDPDKQTPKMAGLIADEVTAAGSSAIMVGGSTLSSPMQVDETVRAIKDNSSLPVILFPSGARFLSKYADAVFFMSLLNSRNLDYVIREHVKGSLLIQKFGIEPISMGYVIVEPGMTAGRVGDADLIGQNDIETAVGYALASEYFGMRFFYLEAGSGANKPVSDSMITGVKKQVNIPLIVGGGIRDVKTAKTKAQAGADIIVTGTALEQDPQAFTTLCKIIKAIQGR